MEKKRILITGAGSGLGKDAAIVLARRGHKIFACVHYVEQLNSLKEISSKEKLDMDVLKLDILNEEERNILKKLNIDVFIVNSAIGDSGSIAEIDIRKIEKVFQTNVFDNLRTVQLIIDNMINQNTKGRIIFVSSLAGRVSIPFLSPYCATKFALESFASSLKQELKILRKLKQIDIDVKIIEPGAYATGFNKINIDKKYSWMYTNSYFSGYVDKIQKYEEKIWSLIEVKKYNSIIYKYVIATETKSRKTRYTATWWQSFFVQILRIFGM